MVFLEKWPGRTVAWAFVCISIALPWQHLPGKDMRVYRRDARERKIPVIKVLDAQDVRDFFTVCTRTHYCTPSVSGRVIGWNN